MTASTLHQMVLFLTSVDEARLGEELVSHIPALRFVDSAQGDDTATPELRTSLAGCRGRLVTLVDTSIVSEGRFHEEYVVRHPAGHRWTYAMVGTGLVSLLRQGPTSGGLLNSELRASVPRGDHATPAFVAELERVVRAGARRVVPVDPEAGAVGRRADRRLLAWPDAAARYDGGDEGVLVNSATAWFVAKQGS